MFAGRGKGSAFLIGYAHDAHLLATDILHDMGGIIGLEHGAALFGGEVGGHGGHLAAFEELHEGETAVVEFMVAEGHGVPRHMVVDLGQHGGLVHAEEQRALELVAGVHEDDVVLFGLDGLHGGSHTAKTAYALLHIEGRVAALVDACHVGMRVVGVQDNEFKALLFLQEVQGTSFPRTAGQAEACGEEQGEAEHLLRADAHHFHPFVMHYSAGA